ncbi:cyclin-U4-1 [Cinnamomum micranthum f. kanehirae]|uniref:Cyclin n=1 Tax=Cinnamomum micranthum f. kanehirae TaxID=337451 RepID=A0A443N4C4_9MAGN|nr:cyclin-U4-1 [Cinnamomum micranthum f. kanehirae]
MTKPFCLQSSLESNSNPMTFLGDFRVDPKDKFIRFFSSQLQRVAESNYWTTIGTGRISAFDVITSPTISIQSYLERIVRNASCSPACFVVAYIYLDRFSKHQRPPFPINSFNFHRLLLTSILVAAKFMDGIHCSNGYYARIGGINSTKFMNVLEQHFLFGINFRLNITINDFYSYVGLLHREMLIESPPLTHAPMVLQARKRKCSCSEDKSAQTKQKLTV